MALTIATTKRELSGRQRVVEGTATFDSSYATGGESFAPSSIGLVAIDRIFFEQGEDGYLFFWDSANEKIKIFESGTASAALDEQDSAADMSGVVVRFRAYGT